MFCQGCRLQKFHWNNQCIQTLQFKDKMYLKIMRYCLKYIKNELNDVLALPPFNNASRGNAPQCIILYYFTLSGRTLAPNG